MGRRNKLETDLGEEAHELSDTAPLVETETTEVINLNQEGRRAGGGAVNREEGEGIDLHSVEFPRL